MAEADEAGQYRALRPATLSAKSENEDARAGIGLRGASWQVRLLSEMVFGSDPMVGKHEQAPRMAANHRLAWRLAAHNGDTEWVLLRPRRDLDIAGSTITPSARCSWRQRRPFPFTASPASARLFCDLKFISLQPLSGPCFGPITTDSTLRLHTANRRAALSTPAPVLRRPIARPFRPDRARPSIVSLWHHATSVKCAFAALPKVIGGPGSYLLMALRLLDHSMAAAVH
jgi:hypothetical protein